MLRNQTVLILGAGASYDYGFPTGDELTQKIHECLTSEYKDIGSKLESLGFTQDQLFKFQDKIRELELPTLDLWIQEHEEYTNMAKAAIAIALIQYEKDAAIQKPKPPKKHWYMFLFQQMLGENADQGRDFGVSASNLRIITFNYDRSLEHYFFKALTNAYDEKRAIELYNMLSITHMYGRLGGPHFINPTDSNGRPFDPTVTNDAITKCMNSMKMVTEIKGQMDINFFLHHFIDTTLVCFLGFGHAPQKIYRLMSRPDLWSGKEIYGTAYHLPQTRVREVIEQIPGIKLGGREEDVQTFLEINRILY